VSCSYEAPQVHARVSNERQSFRTVELKIRFEDFETYTGSKSIREYTNSLTAIKEHANTLLKQFRNDERKVRLIGVRVSNLRKMVQVQQILFSLGQ